MQTGHTYERANIQKHLARSSRAPLSGVQLKDKTLMPNHALRNAIEEFCQQNGITLPALPATLKVNAVNSMGSNAALNANPQLLENAFVIHAARYGWAVDIWNAALGSGNNHGGGAKDVTDIVRRHVINNELHINREAQYMNRTFWPETAPGPPIPRRLAVKYSIGAVGGEPSDIMTVETPAVPHETVALHLPLPPAPPPGYIPAQDVQGCWGCVCFPFFFSALERRRAAGPDVLFHEGVCFPLLMCFKDRYHRVGSSNTFEKASALYCLSPCG